MESTDPQGAPGDVENDDGITGSTIPTSQAESELDDWSPVPGSQLDSSVRKVAAASRLLFLTVSLSIVLGKHVSVILNCHGIYEYFILCSQALKCVFAH